MKICALFRDDDAVSSVLGVVLMVAVTIVLAAVIGTFVLGIGQDLTDPSPTVTFEYSMDVNDDDSVNSSVVVLHSNGDQFDRSNVEVTVDGRVAYVADRTGSSYSIEQRWPRQVSAGDRLELEDDGTQMDSGEVLRIIWSDEEHASIIGEQRLD